MSYIISARSKRPMTVAFIAVGVLLASAGCATASETHHLRNSTSAETSAARGIWAKSWANMSAQEKKEFMNAMENMNKDLWLGLGYDGRRLAFKNERSMINEVIRSQEQHNNEIHSKLRDLISLELHLPATEAASLRDELYKVADGSIREVMRVSKYTYTDTKILTVDNAQYGSFWDLVDRMASKKISHRYGSDSSIERTAQEYVPYALRGMRRLVDLKRALKDIERGEMENESGPR